MSAQQDVLGDVASVIREVLDKPDQQVTPATTAADMQGWDSLRQVKLLMAVEKRFELSFRSREIDKIGSVGDLVDLIKSKTAA